MIHPTAIIYPNVRFVDKEKVHIGAYCVIGGPPEDKKYFDKEPEFGVVIDENVRLSEFVTIHAGTEHPTIIHRGAIIFQKTHIAHDCIIGEDVIIGGQVSLAGHTQVLNGANVSGKAATLPKVVIGQYAFIGANSLVIGHVPPGEKWIGFPARKSDENSIGLLRGRVNLDQLAGYREMFTQKTEGVKV